MCPTNYLPRTCSAATTGSTLSDVKLTRHLRCGNINLGRDERITTSRSDSVRPADFSGVRELRGPWLGGAPHSQVSDQRLDV